MSFEGFLDDFSSKDVLIDCVASFSEDAGNFELVVSDFIVSCLEWNTELKELLFDFFKSKLNVSGDFSIIMLASLLIPGRIGTDQNSSEPLEIFSLLVCSFGNCEKLLFQTEEHF